MVVTSGAVYGNQPRQRVLSSYRLAHSRVPEGNQSHASKELQLSPSSCNVLAATDLFHMVSAHLPVGSKVLGRSLGLSPP